MSTEVQTPPKVDNLMEKNNTHARRRHDKVQSRRNTVSSVTSCGTTGNIGGGGDTGNGGAGAGVNSDYNKQHKKNKHDSENRHFKTVRKRLQSFNGIGGKFFPPYKRRKKEGIIVPPTKFLLGGNICDPLNLNSLQDEEVNRAMNAVTPKSSPLPTPRHRKGQVEVIIPPNIYDPLNLAACDDDAEYEAMLTSPVKRSQKKQKKNKKRKHPRSLSGPGSGKEDNADETRLSGDEKKSSEEELGSMQEPSESAANATVPKPTTVERRSVEDQDPPMKISNTNEFGEVSVPVSTEPTTAVISNEIKPEDVEEVDASAPTGSKTEDMAIPSRPTVVENKTSLKAELNLDLDVCTNFKLPQPSSNLAQCRETKKDNNSMSNCNLNFSGGAVKKLRRETKDKIVSPVVPQPGAWGDPRNHWYRSQPQRLTPQINKGQATPKFKENNTRFQYGNYNRYYGYRNANEDCDVRLKVLARRKELFESKDVLDIGCNVGHVTLAIARDFKPKKIVGIDIDRSLIDAAKKNIRHYLNPRDIHYPLSMPLLYGPVNIPSTSQADVSFPHNISFIQGNYVVESDVLLTMDQPQFDTILCLSITKWFHLNWGDEGLKRAFKRMYAQLRPGGVLILEPQPWHSYKKKRNLTAQIWKNYQNIELFPHKFSQYLLSEVGFTKCEVIGAPLHHSRGFQRPIKLFTKGGGDLQSAPISTTVCDVDEVGGGNVDQNIEVSADQSTINNGGEIRSDVGASNGNQSDIPTGGVNRCAVENEKVFDNDKEVVDKNDNLSSVNGSSSKNDDDGDNNVMSTDGDQMCAEDIVNEQSSDGIAFENKSKVSDNLLNKCSDVTLNKENVLRTVDKDGINKNCCGNEKTECLENDSDNLLSDFSLKENKTDREGINRNELLDSEGKS